MPLISRNYLNWWSIWGKCYSSLQPCSQYIGVMQYYFTVMASLSSCCMLDVSCCYLGLDKFFMKPWGFASPGVRSFLGFSRLCCLILSMNIICLTVSASSLVPLHTMIDFYSDCNCFWWEMMMFFVVGPNNWQKEVVCAQINMVHLALHWLIARYSWDFLEITPQLISRRDQLLAQP